MFRGRSCKWNPERPVWLPGRQPGRQDNRLVRVSQKTAWLRIEAPHKLRQEGADFWV